MRIFSSRQPHGPQPPEHPATLELASVYETAVVTLRLGFTLSAFFFLLGLAWSIVAREEITHQVTPIQDIPGQLADGTPMASVVLGFLILMLTPVLTVLRLAVSFFRMGDPRYGALTFVVLVILASSMALSLAR
jgi:uncharacterized membrane protein